MPPDHYIWVNRWDEFQSFQKKRGKPWAPPWIKIYPQLLDDVDFLSLSWQAQLVLLKVFMAFSQTRGRLSADTRELSRQLAQRVTRAQIEALNHAGWIDICSRTVLEQRRNAFWNSSTLEVEVEEEEEQTFLPSNVDLHAKNGRKEGGLTQEEETTPLPDWEPILKDMPA